MKLSLRLLAAALFALTTACAPLGRLAAPLVHPRLIGAAPTAKIGEVSVPYTASTAGNVLQVTGSNAGTYGAVNLGGGANFVTGTLPAANQAAQSMGGAVGGTTAASTLNLTGNASVSGVLPAANQAAQAMGGDVGGTTAASTVNAITGTTPINITAATVQWLKGTASPTLGQAAQTTDTATNTLTLQGQGPFASATGTNRTAGSVAVNLLPPAAGTAEAAFSINRNGTPIGLLRAYPGFATIGALYLGSTAAGAPSGTNYTLYNDNTSTVLNAVTNAIITFAGTTYDTLTTSKHAWGAPFGGITSGPFAFSGNSAIAIGAGGTFTLSAAQQANPVTALTGSLGTSNAIVVLPDVAGYFLFDLSGLTSSTGTLQFKNTTGAVCPTATIGAALGNSLAIVVVDAAGVSNKIACNY